MRKEEEKEEGKAKERVKKGKLRHKSVEFHRIQECPEEGCDQQCRKQHRGQRE